LIVGVFSWLTLIAHNLDQIDYLSDARDALNAFDGYLTQVKRRQLALNHRNALLDADFQLSMKPMATLA
jgi:hypothetical protein